MKPVQTYSACIILKSVSVHGSWNRENTEAQDKKLYLMATVLLWHRLKNGTDEQSFCLVGKVAKQVQFTEASPLDDSGLTEWGNLQELITHLLLSEESNDLNYLFLFFALHSKMTILCFLGLAWSLLNAVKLRRKKKYKFNIQVKSLKGT